MSKILKIDEEAGIVYIWRKRNEIIETEDISNLNFSPKLGDIIDVYYETNNSNCFK